MISASEENPYLVNNSVRYAVDYQKLLTYLKPSTKITLTKESLVTAPISNWRPGMLANRDFLENPVWSQHYFAVEHRDQNLRKRYQTVLGSIDGKVIVDIGCGPGNWLNLMAGQPHLIIGIDLSENALELARSIGYTPLLADAHDLPLIDRFADVVILNATLHHCDDMRQVLGEAARLVHLNGLLVTDLDPQSTAWQLKGIGHSFHRARRLTSLIPGLRRLLGRSPITWKQQMARLKTEVHNSCPGDGVSLALYREVLVPRGFEVQLFPHNHTLGTEVLQGQWGKAPALIRWAQRLSGMNPDLIESAQSVMCVAQRIR
jgi:SAM-dependent methyltransferase